MTQTTDILTYGTYEVHPSAHPLTGESTGWYAVVQSTTGEVVSRHPNRDLAITDAVARDKAR